MKKYIINELSKKYGVSAGEIESGMQEAINAAYKNPNKNAPDIASTNHIPTPDEVIDYVMARLK